MTILRMLWNIFLDYQLRTCNPSAPFYDQIFRARYGLQRKLFRSGVFKLGRLTIRWDWH